MSNLYYCQSCCFYSFHNYLFLYIQNTGSNIICSLLHLVHDDWCQRKQYICQDMTELDLYGEADIIVSTLDSVNHLSSAADITKFFRAAALNLRRGGLLLFDFNTIYKHEKVLADNVFVYDLDDVYCVWQNEFNPEDKGVDISLNIFAEAEDGLYERMEENFREITMPSEQVEKLLSESGFEVLEVREYLTNREPGAQSDKLMFCARKK